MSKKRLPLLLSCLTLMAVLAGGCGSSAPTAHTAPTHRETHHLSSYIDRHLMDRSSDDSEGPVRARQSDTLNLRRPSHAQRLQTR